MKIRQKFEFYNFILLAAPIALIGVVSVLFLIIFVMTFPVEEIYSSRAALINPIMLMRAIGTFFNNNPSAITYLLLYILLCITICVITSTIITRRLSGSLESPIRRLRNNVDEIRNGSLNFEVIGSEFDELDDLAEGVDAMRRALLLAREREAQLRHERNMLIANISHDLKTPITSIRGYIDGIHDGVADTPEKLEKYLHTIKSKTNIIDELVSNLSTFARLETNGLDFRTSNGDLRDLVLDVIDSYRIDFEDNGIEFYADILPQPLVVNIDGEKMRRVLTNLIDNSIKYRTTENPQIEIKCFAVENNAYITVSDNGQGISQSEIPHIFDSFYRTDSSRTSQIKGNGLGLSIAKQITEKHNGKLWIQSDGHSKGCKATICLPVTKGAVNEENSYNRR